MVGRWLPTGRSKGATIGAVCRSCPAASSSCVEWEWPLAAPLLKQVRQRCISVLLLLMCCICLRIPDAVKNSIGTRADVLLKEVHAFNQEHTSLMTTGAAGSGNGSGSGTQTRRNAAPNTNSRTQSRPVFAPPSAPVDVSRVMESPLTAAMGEIENMVGYLACSLECP